MCQSFMSKESYLRTFGNMWSSLCSKILFASNELKKTQLVDFEVLLTFRMVFKLFPLRKKCPYPELLSLNAGNYGPD